MAFKRIVAVVLLCAACLISYALGAWRQAAESEKREKRLAAEKLIDAKYLEAMHRVKTEGKLIEEALHSPTERDRNLAFQELVRRRSVEKSGLIKVAGDAKGPPMTRFFAVKLLGLYHDPDAMLVLIQNLDWKYSDGQEGPCPCAKALVQFGPACAAPLLMRTARDGDLDDKKLRLRASILESVYLPKSMPWGADEAVGVVERYRDRVPPDWADARENLQRLVETLKKRPLER